MFLWILKRFLDVFFIVYLKYNFESILPNSELYWEDMSLKKQLKHYHSKWRTFVLCVCVQCGVVWFVVYSSEASKPFCDLNIFYAGNIVFALRRIRCVCVCIYEKLSVFRRCATEIHTLNVHFLMACCTQQTAAAAWSRIYINT